MQEQQHPFSGQTSESSFEHGRSLTYKIGYMYYNMGLIAAARMAKRSDRVMRMGKLTE
jgi:hypothetical protein